MQVLYSQLPPSVSWIPCLFYQRETIIIFVTMDFILRKVKSAIACQFCAFLVTVGPNLRFATVQFFACGYPVGLRNGYGIILLLILYKGLTKTK